MQRVERVLGHARPHPAQRAVVHDRREHHPFHREGDDEERGHERRPTTAVWLRRSRRTPSANGDSARAGGTGHVTPLRALAFIHANLWLSLFPGVAIFFTVLGFNLFGDGLRDALDPRLK